MRNGILIAALVIILYDWGGERNPASSVVLEPSTPMNTEVAKRSETGTQKSVDFHSEIKPILQSSACPATSAVERCTLKCPFDRAETLRKLGTKLFTRIHDESQRRPHPGLPRPGIVAV